MTSLQPPNPPMGHRRVKSLVREFDEAIKTPPANPTALSPESPLSPVSPPSSSRQPQGTHTRRAASVSYSSASPAPLASPPFTYKSSAFSPTSHSMRGAAPGLDGLGPSPSLSPGGGASGLLNKRRGSAPTTSPSTSAQRSVSGSSAASLENVREDAAERAEEDDVFLPLASDPQTPFTASLIAANGRTPTIPAAGQQQQHQRKHSRIHERNLSAFFPRPGQAPGAGYGDTYDDPNASAYQPPAVRDIPPARDDAASPEDARGKARRGHHHRHSLSHNFAASSFLDPTSPTSDFSASPSSAYGPSSPFPMSPPASSGAAFLPAPGNRARYAHLPSALRFLVFVVLYLPLQTQLALALASAQVLLGATLWVTGQSGESLAVTGLGYLVVFDGIGGLSRTFVEGGAGVDHMWALWGSPRLEKGVRLPFGTQRLVTLSHFSQAIYLLFSAVYVCKESVEHVLLLHGGTEAEGAHGAGHGMGHGDGGGGGAASSTTLDAGISLPIVLLAFAALLSVTSAIALRNHQGLSDAVGPSSFSRPRPRSSSPSLLDLVGNPFTLTVLTFSAGLAASAFVIPSAQLAPLDKVVALLESIAMFYVAYPAAVATGQVLLQTSPAAHAAQMTTLNNGIRDIENHPLVVEVPAPHIWQLTPYPPTTPSSPSVGRRPGKSIDGATLIATLSVLVKPDATDGDLLLVTKFARERCALAGELTVSVTRAKRRTPQGPVQFFGHHSMDAPRVEANGGHGGHDHASHGGHSHQH